MKRVTLKALMPNATEVFKKLFETLEIQEPGFKNVVVLYRRTIPDEPTPKSEKSPIREYDPVSHVLLLHVLEHACAGLLKPDTKAELISCTHHYACSKTRHECSFILAHVLRQASHHSSS